MSKSAVLSQEDINLLSKSEYIKENKILLNIISLSKSHKRPIYIDEIKHLEQEDYNTYSLILHGKKELINKTISEWECKGIEDRGVKKCELCGSNQLIDNYIIVNKINKNEMVIGSSCRDKFNNLKPNKMEKKNENKKKKIIKRKRLIHNYCKEYLNSNNYLRLEDVFSEFQNFYNNFPILLNYNLDKEIVNTLKSITNFYKDFINSKIAEKEVSNILKLINKFEYIKVECNKFYEEQRHNKFICDRNIINWINKYNKNIKNEIINSNGKIIKSTAAKIYSYDFIKRFEQKIILYFEKNKFNFINLDDNQVIISYKTKELFDIDLVISLKEFSKYFSSIFYDNLSDNDTNIIISKFNLLWDKDNIGQYLFMINQYRLNKTNYSLDIIERNNTLYKSIKVIKNDKYFIDTNDKIFIDLLKSYINKDKYTTKENLCTYINSLKGWKNIKKEEKSQHNLERYMTSKY